jgi:hypothetical protein
MSWLNPWDDLKSAVNAVGDAANSVAHGIADAARAIADFVSNPEGLLSALKRIAQFLGDAYVGYLLGGLSGEVLLEVADVLGFSTVEQLYNFLAKLRVIPRSLRPAEINLVNLVFNTDDRGRPLATPSVPPDKLRITPLTGINGRWMTIPASFSGLLAARAFLTDDVYDPLFALAAVSGLLWSDKYLINAGPDAYDHGADTQANVFVHECTHAWQGRHWSKFLGVLNWSYVFEAIFHRDYDYGYAPTTQWHDYGAEQQAKIVEEWFTGGAGRPVSPPHLVAASGGMPARMTAGIFPPYAAMDTGNPSYRFINKNVWPGLQDAFSDESVLSPVSHSLHPLVTSSNGTGSGTPASAGGGGSGYSKAAPPPGQRPVRRMM